MWRWNLRYPFEENNFYHIYNRWFNKSIIFNNDRDYEKFYSYIVTFLKDYETIKMVSWSFLPNHFHFVIHYTGATGTDYVSKFMKRLQWSYSIWHRVNYPLGTGNKLPFFEWRFKAKLLKDEDYLAKCIAYVNFNPLKHQIVDNIDNYKWTSYHQIDKKKIDMYKDLILDELEF
jgi:putative transposase